MRSTMSKTVRVARRGFIPAVVVCGLLAPVTVVLRPASAEDAAGDKWVAPARASRKANPVAADAASIAAGKVVYGRECAQCHGEAGKGDGPASKDLPLKPHDLGAANVAEQTDGALFWKITEGRKPMPSYEKLLSDNDRWQVINYLRTFGPKRDSSK